MNIAQGTTFRSYSVLYISVVSVGLIGMGIYLYFRNGLPGILVAFLGLAFLVLPPLFVTLSLTVDQLGVYKHSILSSWRFRWTDITGWNVVNVSSKGATRYTIWFRVGRSVFKIDPDVIKNDGGLETLKAYFEANCGKQIEGENRLRQRLFSRN